MDQTEFRAKIKRHNPLHRSMNYLASYFLVGMGCFIILSTPAQAEYLTMDRVWLNVGIGLVVLLGGVLMVKRTSKNYAVHIYTIQAQDDQALSKIRVIARTLGGTMIHQEPGYREFSFQRSFFRMVVLSVAISNEKIYYNTITTNFIHQAHVDISDFGMARKLRRQFEERLNKEFGVACVKPS